VRHYATGDAQAERAARAVEAEVRRLEARYSRYRSDSIAAQINRSAGSGQSIELDAETAALIDYAQTAWEQSEGQGRKRGAKVAATTETAVSVYRSPWRGVPERLMDALMSPPIAPTIAEGFLPHRHTYVKHRGGIYPHS